MGFDKGRSRQSLNATLTIEELAYASDLAFPFFFSHADFPDGRPGQPEPQLDFFFTEYVKIVPHMLDALRLAIPEAETFLRSIGKL